MLRDGLNCQRCKQPSDLLDIDHVDGNPTNDDPSNLRLLCRSCNTSGAIRRAQGLVSFLEREGEKGTSDRPPSVDPTSMVRSKVNYSRGSAEMQVNDIAETDFRNWAFAFLLNKGDAGYPLEDLVSDGAEMTGTSINAVRNYLAKMLSKQFGPLEKFRFAGKGPFHVGIKQRFRQGVLNDKVTASEAAQGVIRD